MSQLGVSLSPLRLVCPMTLVASLFKSEQYLELLSEVMLWCSCGMWHLILDRASRIDRGWCFSCGPTHTMDSQMAVHVMALYRH